MTTTSTPQHIRRPDGRRVALHDLTPDAPAGAPVVLFCHAAPGSGAFDPDPAETAARGIRLVAPDRPGYGGSDPVSGGAFATVETAAEDAAAVLESILAPGSTAAVAGWSAGGRVALALAARRPDLVGRVAVIGTPAPDEEVPWIPEENRAGVEALRGAPAEVAHEALTAAFGPVLAALTGDARFGLVGIDEVDGPVLAEPGVSDRVRAMLDEALVQGGAGMVADIAGYTLQPYGFDPADVAAQVLLAYGSADAIGQAHGVWWQRQLPDARLEMVPGAGHLLIVPFWKRALAHLVPA
ncbi:alpha/beta fold hydrolase [Pseudonocardia xinjiangensis]|uniref:alpha/beta fold hydrolase n=1 Tax=Pseudonocardia xinjiangensis TaxID=75289 RepID=UPI003D911579